MNSGQGTSEGEGLFRDDSSNEEIASQTETTNAPPQRPIAVNNWSDLMREGEGLFRDDSSNEEISSQTETINAPPQRPSAVNNWSNLKDIVNNTRHCDEQSKHSSMTEQEREFLKMRSTSKIFRTQNNRFADVVEAAVAREKLRTELQVRLSRLTTNEAQFLKDIVEDEDVTEQQLVNADRVLRNDPLYRLPHEEEYSSDDESVETGETGIVANEIRASDLDVSIEVDQNEIELIIRAVSIDEREAAPSSEKYPLAPSTYSYKTWDLIKDQPQEYPIMGVSEDIIETSRVLSPSMIDSLRNFLPYAVSEDNFWLKYNLSQDGASLDALYHSIRQSSKTLLAIETFDGEVFGAFVSSPWRNQKGFYGSCEAFIWKVKESRFSAADSVEEQAKIESKLAVFKWSQENRNIQMIDRTKIAIGGGCPEECGEEEWGLGIALDDTLHQGTSSPCITFRSPNLATNSSKGQVFDVSNLEVWTLTPCQNEKEAEQLELGRMFVLSHFAS